MKANFRFKFLCLLFAGLGGLLHGDFAAAHHASETLELYPGDASDPCIDGTQQIRVSVYGVSHVGIIKLELYDEDEGFLQKKGRLRRIRLEAQDSPQKICINVPSPGEYAVAGYHDKDGDRKLDKKWNFTPKEPYGLSMNPVIKSLRFPKFSEAAFIVTETGLEIDMYLVDLRKKKDTDEKAETDG